MSNGTEIAAIITAVGGLIGSIMGVYLSARKSGDSSDCEERLDALTQQIADMAVQIADLKRQNASLVSQAGGTNLPPVP